MMDPRSSPQTRIVGPRWQSIHPDSACSTLLCAKSINLPIFLLEPENRTSASSKEKGRRGMIAGSIGCLAVVASG